MKLRVLFFAHLRERLGVSTQDCELSTGATVGELQNHLLKQFPVLSTEKFLIARNQIYADSKTQLAEGDEIAFLPPVSGG